MTIESEVSLVRPNGSCRAGFPAASSHPWTWISRPNTTGRLWAIGQFRRQRHRYSGCRVGCPDNRLVGVRGFEPPAPASRTQCSTRLSYTPAEARRIAPPDAGDNPHIASSARLYRSRPRARRLGLTVVPVLHQLQHGRRRLLDRSPRHVDRRPAVAVAEPARPQQLRLHRVLIDVAGGCPAPAPPARQSAAAGGGGCRSGPRAPASAR